MIIVKNREMLIPGPERYIGTTYDTESENRQFLLSRFAQNGVDLSALTFRLDLKYSNDATDTVVLDKEVTDTNIILTWNIGSSVLQVPGTLFIQLRAVDDEVTVKWSSFHAALYVERHLNTPGTYTGSLTEIEQIEQDHQYMKGVVDELKSNLDYAHDAEAWAQGTRSGEAVPSTDETYHKNSKYYSEQASAKATQAANSATAAANSATQAAETVSDTNTRFNNAMAAVTSDTEVIDARVGADGTQHTVLKNRLDAEHNQLKNHLEEITGVSVISYTKNTYVRTADNPISLTQQSQSGFDSAIVSCQAGDVFTVSGRGAASAHIAEFTDASGNKLSGGIDTTGGNITNRVITAPTNAAYLVLNNYRTNYPGATSYKGDLVSNALDALNGRVNNAKTDIDAINAQISLSVYFDPNDFETSSISPATGENVTDSTRIRSKAFISDDITEITGTSTNQIMLFAYSGDSYVGVWNGTSFGTTAAWLEHVSIDATYGYSYRLLIKNDGRESPISTVVERISYIVPALESMQEDIAELKERENTDRIFIANDDVSKAQNASAVFALYDQLVTDYSDYVTKNTLTSGTLTNYEYVFDSGNYNAGNGQRQKDSAVPKPVVLITTGVHGNEPAAVMSAYTIFKALCENRNSISRIRNDFIFKVIPVVVPWGYTNDKRWNENGVNINRNFDAGWVADGEPYTNSYSGESAASEDETKIVQAWITANPNAALLIDFHNSGYQNELSYIGIVAGETYSDPVRWAYRYGINDIIGHWQKDRGVSGASIIYGYTGPMQIGGSTQYYAQQTIPSCTFETSNNQNGEGLNSAITIGIGAEAFAALLIGLTDHYFRA